MPKAMELALLREAKKRGMSKERTGAFVYGTMRKKGWKPNSDKSIRMKAVAKMRAMRKKKRS